MSLDVEKGHEAAGNSSDSLSTAIPEAGDTLPSPPHSKEHSVDSVKPQIPPEAGVAGWTCVVGCFICIFCSFGFLNAYFTPGLPDIVQLTWPKQSRASDISWIFALQLCLIWLPGPLWGRVLDTYGPRPILIPASILCVFALCMTSLCKEYYQVFLAQGLAYGIGAGGIFTVGVVCTGQWFEKKQRGLALGIVTSGSSLGGVIYPSFAWNVYGDVGFDTMLRWLALFNGILLVTSWFLVRSRLPKKKWDSKTKWVDFRLFKDKPFAFYCMGAYLVMWGLWAPFDYIPTMAQDIAGFSPSLSIYLIAIINAGSTPGRIIPGWLGDRFGFFNMMSIVSFLAGISIVALWIPFDYHPSHAGIFVFAVAYGILSGGFVSLLAPCAVRSGDLKQLGQRFGTFQLVMALSNLTGLPIQGAILARDPSYLGTQLFAACSMLLGSAMIISSRFLIGGTSLKKRV